MNKEIRYRDMILFATPKEANSMKDRYEKSLKEEQKGDNENSNQNLQGFNNNS